MPTNALALAGCLAGLLVVAAPSADGQVASPPSPDTLATRVDSLLAQWSGADRPGCAVGVSRHGRVLLERGYGMARIESGVPMTPTTVAHSASLAKSVTAMAVLLLVRDGRLSLDDDVRRWLPELPDYAMQYGTPITVRHLLSHTSGLRDFFELLILARGRHEGERFTAIDAMAMIARQRALNFAPGAEYGYNNTGYLLAAQLVERISGQRFAAFAADRIFAPLGMTRTRFRDDFTPVGAETAHGYARDGVGWRLVTPDYDVVGPTNLQTTVGDQLRWAANLDRPVVGDSALVRQMLVPGLLATGDTTRYGLGLSLVRDRGERVAEHEGRDPGFRAYLGRYLDSGVAVALLCNAPVNSVGLGRDVAGVYVGGGPDAPASPPPATAATPGDSTGALAWAGVYLEPVTRQVAELTVRNGVLYTDRATGVRVEAIGPRRARLVGQPLELDFGPGPRAGYTVRWLVPGRRADAFGWRAPITPVLDPRALAGYAGTYESPELGVRFRIDAGDSTLTLRAAAGTGLVARPVFADGFVSGQYTIQFIRRGGRVSGFEISHPRARGVAFMRVDATR